MVFFQVIMIVFVFPLPVFYLCFHMLSIVKEINFNVFKIPCNQVYFDIVDYVGALYSL